MAEAMLPTNGAILRCSMIVDYALAAILLLLTCAYFGHRVRMARRRRNRQSRRSVHRPAG